MKLAWAGAFKGAGDAALDSLQAREKARLELEKDKQLAAMRTEQAKILADYQDVLDHKKLSKDFTEQTDTGIIWRDGDGNEIGRRNWNPAELAARNAERQKDELDVEYKRTQINSTKQRMALDLQENNRQNIESAARVKSYRSGGRGRGGSNDNDTDSASSTAPQNVVSKTATELVYNNKAASDYAKAAGVSPAEMQSIARTTATQWGLQGGQAKNYRSLDEKYIDAVTRIADSRKASRELDKQNAAINGGK